MTKNEKNSEPQSDQNKAEEPETAFKTVHIFDSFEDEAEYNAKQRAAMSYGERMQNIEKLRKRVFHQYLLPNGKWPSISKTFKIMDPYVSEIGK